MPCAERQRRVIVGAQGHSVSSGEASMASGKSDVFSGLHTLPRWLDYKIPLIAKRRWNKCCWCDAATTRFSVMSGLVYVRNSGLVLYRKALCRLYVLKMINLKSRLGHNVHLPTYYSVWHTHTSLETLETSAEHLNYRKCFPCTRKVSAELSAPYACCSTAKCFQNQLLFLIYSC